MIPKTFDGNDLNDSNIESQFIDPTVYGLPRVDPLLVDRAGDYPVIAGITRPGKQLQIRIYIRGSVAANQANLPLWFDPDDETPKELIGEDSAGGGDRLVEAICTRLQEVAGSAGLEYIATLQVHGDPLWRSTVLSSHTWDITSGTDNEVIANNGEAPVRPRFTIQPQGAKSSSWAYREFIDIQWRVDEAYEDYPIDIVNASWNTATLVSGGKMQADGDDLRVFVNGVERYRYLSGINTANTKVWVNLDFEGQKDSSIQTAILATGDVLTIDLKPTDPIETWPSSGIVRIDNETFTYTGINLQLAQLQGVKRAQRGTTAAAHSVSAIIWLVQHDVQIIYGNSGAAAPDAPAFSIAPIFELTSTNTSWIFQEFGGNGSAHAGRPAHWQTAVWEQLGGDITFYTGNREANANPFVEIGSTIIGTRLLSAWFIFNPCGITAANFTNGEQWTDDTAYDHGVIWSYTTDNEFWDKEYPIPAPGSASTWASWSRNETLDTNAIGVALTNRIEGDSAESRFEAADCTLTLNSSNTPLVNMSGENGNYSLDCEIKNTDADQAVELDYLMALNEDLELDCDLRTVTDKENESSQFQALTVVGGPRRSWLQLAPGNNNYRFTDTGTTDIEITVEWYERYYH